MSIYFDFEVGSTGRRFRRAVDEDKNDIETFWDHKTTSPLFSADDIGYLIELSTLSICMINENKEVTGFMALCDHPNVPSVDPADWEVWMRNLFQMYYLSRNTLFIHFMCCIDSVKEFFMEEALLSVFLNDVYLLHIILMVPQSCPVECFTKYQTFKKRLLCKHDAKRIENEQSHYMYCARRKDFCPKLKIRRAVEEDNDDIVQLLDKKCHRLKNLYGNYYISELVGRHPESQRKIIVAEIQDKVVGVMCLNTDVNYKKLQTTYELGIYHGLRKITNCAKNKQKRNNSLLTTFGDPIMLGQWSPFDKIEKIDVNQIEDVPSKENVVVKRQSKVGKVNFSRRQSLRQSFDHLFYSSEQSEDYNTKFPNFYATSPSPSQATEVSMTCLLDEELLDYEIVNIDHSLFTLPEFKSAESFQKTEHNRDSRNSEYIRNKFKSKNMTINLKLVEPDVCFLGEPNAFIIELFDLRDDIDDRRAFHLLEAAFEITKIYEYCIIRVPSAQKGFSLLQHFCFVPPKPNVCCQYVLYIAHRNSVFGKLRVRPAEYADIPQIATLLNDLDASETVWTVEHGLEDKKQHQAYVFICGYSIIGVGILEPPEQIDFIRAKYTLDLYQKHKYHVVGQGLNSIYSTLKTAIVNPAFEVHFRYFAREMLRLSGSSTLLWMTAYRNKWVVHKANALVSSMIPVMPRKSVLEYGLISELKKLMSMAKNIMAFSTWFMDNKMTSVPMLNVDTRIVVIGASRTAMSFLNTLLFGDSSTYLTFTSVTLISPNGLPYMKKMNATAEMFFPRFRTSVDRFMKSTPYTYYVNVVHGTLVEINKQDRWVGLHTGHKYYYDLLFILTGEQYQHPLYLKPMLERCAGVNNANTPPYIRLDVPRYIEIEPTAEDYDTPENVFIINKIANAQKALNYVNSILWQDDCQVVVYGATIHAYCCLAALIEMKVPPENIVFVEPFPSEDPKNPRIPIFCNAYIDQTMREVLATLEIKVYRAYYFQSWICDRDNLVTHVEIMSHFQMIRIPCSAFFYYGKRGVNPHAFVAIHKSGMAYDGGICINNKFRTKDPAIYAAGPITRYCREYYADDKRQKYYSSYEVGKKLGTQIRNHLDPLFPQKVQNPIQDCEKGVSFDSSTTGAGDYASKGSSNSHQSQSKGPEDERRLPELKSPLVWNCVLPGGLQYLEVRPPGMKNPHFYLQSLHYNGYMMETFKGGYFKLHLTTDYIVDGITCLTPERYSLENFKNIYGQSTFTLNNVHMRFTANRVDDFYAFFRSPWAIFLYHDHVDDLLAMAKELLPKGQPKGQTIKETLHDISDKITTINPSYGASNKIRMRNNFERSAHFEAITDYVIEWLTESDILLPMYLQPWQLGEFEHDLGRHPAFKRRKYSIHKLLLKQII